MKLEARLLEAFVSGHPAQTARTLESMPTSDAAEVMAELSDDVLAGLVPSMAPISAANTLQLLTIQRAARVLSETRSDVAAAVIRAMGAAQRTAILESLGTDAGRTVKPLLRYSERTAGALLDPRVLPVPDTVTAGEALERIRHHPRDALYYVYVVSDVQKLVGVTNLLELLAARTDQQLGLIAVRQVVSLTLGASWEAIVAHPAWDRFHALPVVEADGRFVGVVRYESIRDLERRLVETDLEDHGSQTAAALGELYGLGLRGLVEWAASAVFGSPEPEGGRR